MPASPTDSTSSTSGAARDRAATEAAATAPETTSQPTDGARDVTQSVSAPSGTGSGSGTKTKSTDPVCPTCRGPLERYLGEAAHKLGSYWCHACGMRQRLPASPPADDGTAPVGPSGTSGTSGTKAAG